MSCQANVLTTTTDSQRKLIIWHNNQSSLVVFCMEDNLIDLSWSNGIVDVLGWISNPFDDIDIFLSRNHTATFGIILGWVEFAGNLLDIGTTTSDDGSDRIHVWIVATNRYLGSIARFTRHAHDFHSSVVNFRNFLLHQALDHLWMATANEDIDTTRIIFYLVDKNFDAVMRGKDLTRNLVLFR